ncbi:DUF72 domain-containing protein [Catellatospora sp. KI3]|uniref:DUF72 domain-containing protein n=1 Tax=Catellatospora sp. KI3 TaxID=3041620 RepID=UPI00248238B8|nr:DUF72 domain-containing protein [Catellatospora sp. KI3]MDI1465699.1 DUF72 domain-containing protein [Catellatospora sp. KI3]
MILVGTSGWQYRDWRGPFYPPGLPQRQWLAHYAAEFPTVEVNSVFYRLPQRGVFTAWREQTPSGFTVAVKASRYLTHIRRLRDPAEPVRRFLDAVAGLGDRLGPVLLQLPPTMRADPAALADTLRHFPEGRRVAVEPRHPSWWNDAVRAVLEGHGAALCWADRLGRPQTPLWRTADFGYLRLHEGRAQPRPRYGRTALRTWQGRLQDTFGDHPVYVYFNNDPHAAAIADARAFTSLAG